jgi:ATP-binding cassette subfamily B (MDR/TAP) protein 1
VALSVNFISAFATGYILAFARNWRLAFALSSILPCIAIAGGVMTTAATKYMQLSLKHIAEGGTLAEETISSVRTAHAFGTQKLLARMYNTHIEKSEKVDSTAAIWHGSCVGVFFFVIYSAYALGEPLHIFDWVHVLKLYPFAAFSFGTTLIRRGYATPGEVVNVFLAILNGSFSLALLMGEMEGMYISVTDFCAFSDSLICF